MRVPTVMRWPARIKPGQTCNQVAALLKTIVVRDREKFTEDLTEVFYAKSEAHGLRAFWELVVRWERFYPSVVQTLERQLGGASYSV